MVQLEATDVVSSNATLNDSRGENAKFLFPINSANENNTFSKHWSNCSFIVHIHHIYHTVYSFDY